MAYVDLMGSEALITVYQEFADVDVAVFYANLTGTTWNTVYQNSI